MSGPGSSDAVTTSPLMAEAVVTIIPRSTALDLGHTMLARRNSCVLCQSQEARRGDSSRDLAPCCVPQQQNGSTQNNTGWAPDLGPVGRTVSPTLLLVGVPGFVLCRLGRGSREQGSFSQQWQILFLKRKDLENQ